MKELLVPKQLRDHYEPEQLTNLAKVNFFVGENNSGKSRMLRAVFGAEGLEYLPVGLDLVAVQGVLGEYRKMIEQIFNAYHYEEVGRIGEAAKNTMLKNVVLDRPDPFEEIRAALKSAESVGSGTVVQSRDGFSSDNGFNAIRRTGSEARERLEPLLNLGIAWNAVGRVYVPTLRGLRPLDRDRDVYAERTRNDYGNDFPVFGTSKTMPSRRVEIFTGLDMYSQVRSHLLGDLQHRRRISEFQTFLSETFFNRQPVALIPREEGDVLFVKIGNAPERPIHHLGDGIQHLIIMAFPAFMRKGESLLLFIEEPELFLHAALQRILVELFTGEKLPNTQVFIATHSNHLLDLTLGSDT